MTIYPIFTIWQALRHSKVKLTWDEDDPQRNHITRRTLTKQEIEEADFKAYLASSTSGSESESDGSDSRGSGAGRKGEDKKGPSRDKLRALLLAGDDHELPEGWGTGEETQPRDVDMEITFTPGLSDLKDVEKEETTLEKYERKMKEKRKRRKNEQKEKPVVVKNQGMEIGADDDFFDAGGDEQHNTVERSKRAKSKKTTAEQLALLVASDNPNDEPKHFNMKSVLKAENKSKGKGKKSKKKGDLDDNEIQEDFAIDINDDRFKALHEDHTFAIDPSNPQCVSAYFMA